MHLCHYSKESLKKAGGQTAGKMLKILNFITSLVYLDAQNG